jgi:hypothetical protein
MIDLILLWPILIINLDKVGRLRELWHLLDWLIVSEMLFKLLSLFRDLAHLLLLQHLILCLAEVLKLFPGHEALLFKSLNRLRFLTK